MGDKANEVYDDIVYRYKKMDDAPYTLDAAPLRSMQKMERALFFILNNINQKFISLDEVAEQAGYDEAYFIKAFRDYYGCPFQRFVTMLKLRKAALEIQNQNYPKQIGAKYGFANVQSFSKAFRREIGISPRDFFTGNYNVPDMPFRSTVKGVKISLEYSEEHALSVSGVSIKPPRGNDTYLMDSYALAYKTDNDECRRDEQHDKVGIWWYGVDEGMRYVFGNVQRYFDTVYAPESEAAEGDILIQGGNYAVFSYKRPEDMRDISLMSRIMARFIFKEWVPMNAKVTNTIGYTYEKFTSDRVYIYLPISLGMDSTEELKPRKWSIPLWAKYIDEHIKEPLSLESLAIVSGYSHQNYKDVFTMYYNMTPTTYIKRRRLLLALNDILEAGCEDSGALSAYGFTSYDQFRDSFFDEFGEEPDSEASALELPDLNNMYEKNNAKVKVVIKNVPDFRVVMHSIEEAESEELPTDLTGRVLYWFHRDFRDFTMIRDYIKTPEEKVSIWGNTAVFEGVNKVYKYYVGSILKSNADEHALKAMLESTAAIIENVPGGKYAVFRTLDDTDDAKPELAYHLLTVTAFGGWINEYRWRVDLNRRTFVVWRSGRLYFYVPVVR